ncbi:MAG: hydroxyisourate hydrolase [Xanthobacteraceae bacterium]|nr:hydroxyisourate hydrolase [Xanthobacteraceae bacterium]
MGRLSTHVLDTMQGRPAADVRVELFRLDDNGGETVAVTRTNSDGRTAEPLMHGPNFRIGAYELRFHIGEYFQRATRNEAAPPFLDVVPIRFRISEPQGHYHVPLLATPWSYATYRGS